jgi:hypothetical protein
MIESQYWKEDLLKHARKFRKKKKPARWSERLQVEFEKEVILCFFMVRKLVESHKFSPEVLEYSASIFQSKCVDDVTNLNFTDIDELYNLEEEEKVEKNIVFLCNQLIHGGAIFAYRDGGRNWDGIYTSSDYERGRYMYRIPLTAVVEILELCGNDYPKSIRYEYSVRKGDYEISTE